MPTAAITQTSVSMVDANGPCFDCAMKEVYVAAMRR
jgi:hypothetical protein